MQRLIQMRMVFILVVSAILLALATFIGLALIAGRSSPAANAPAADLPPLDVPPAADAPVADAPAAGSRDVFIDGVFITLNGDPNSEVRTLAEVSQPAVVVEGAADGTTPSPPPEAVVVEPAVAPTFTPTPPPPIKFIDYTIQQGDSLYSIAEQNNSAIELMALHGIDSDDLVPGQTVRLPVANPDYCLNARAYVIRDNDTVFRIAQAFGVSVEAIRQRNNLDENFNIKVTDVLCIPPG